MKILIKQYRLNKSYGQKRLLAEFPEKNWKAGGLDKLIRKIDVTGSVGRLRKAWKEIPQCEIDTIIGQF